MCYECKHYNVGFIGFYEANDIELERDDGLKFTKRMNPNRCEINNDLMFNSLHMRDCVCDALISAGWQYMPTVENGCKNYKHFKDE